jgi:hypothetical protein
MYARIDGFEDVGRHPDLEPPEVAGLIGRLQLVQPDGSHALSITFFDAPEAVLRTDVDLEGQTPDSIEVYEVLQHDFPGSPGAARVTRLHGDSEDLAGGLERVERELIPLVSQLPGWCGHLYMAERRTGNAMLIAFWETLEHLHASADKAAELRDRAVEALGQSVLKVEACEVQAFESPVAAAR